MEITLQELNNLKILKAINMPCKSKQQCRLMGAVAGGAVKLKGMSKEKAKEYVRGVKMKKLPTKVTKKK